MRYRFPVKITDVFERKLRKHVKGAGPETIFETSSEGWYIQLNHTISIYMGKEKPSFEIGEKADLAIIRK